MSIPEVIQLSFDTPHLCECGCGKPAPIATKTDRRVGVIKGQPHRFIRPHQGKFRKKSQPTPEERFWSKVDTSGGPDACWTWVAFTNPKGYGLFGWAGKNRLAHRVAWELTKGPIPPGMNVLHHCDNPPCCNSSHHFLGTLADNNVDMTKKGRRPTREQCWNGKLTQVEIDDMRRRHASGAVSFKQLAREKGMSPSRISRVVRNTRK